jgi:hypothetical protein
MLNGNFEQEPIKALVDQMLYGSCFRVVLDFMTGPDLLRIQLLNQHMYNTLVPNYFMTSRERKNIFSKMLIGSKVCRQAILLFQGQS